MTAPPAPALPRGLQRWAYRSHARVPLDSLAVIADIVAVSDRNNRRDDVTGGLVYDDGVFFQVIEGAVEDLQRLMGRLSADTRHADIVVLSTEAIAERLFADWSMTAPRLSPDYEPLMHRTIIAAMDDPQAATTLLHRLAIEDSIHPFS